MKIHKLPTIEERPDEMPQPPVTMGFQTRSKRAKTINVDSSRAHKRLRSNSSIDMSRKRSRNDNTTVQCCINCKDKDTEKNLISCKGRYCSNKIHPSCIPTQFGRMGVELWKCDACQECNICKKEFGLNTPFLKCYLCLRSYHSKCYGLTSEQNIRMVKEKRFCCCDIQKAAPKTQNRTARKNTVLLGANKNVREDRNSDPTDIEDFHGFNESELGTLIPMSTQHSNSMEPLRVQKTNIDRNRKDDETIIPDASKWSQNDVYEYFKVKFPRHAHVFEDEEIDGESLYSLTREDVVHRFKVKLGPSLKIFNHIEKMQQMKLK